MRALTRRLLWGTAATLLLPFAASLPFVATRLTAAMENQDMECVVDDCPMADAIVVLGGERRSSHWMSHPAGSRIGRGAALYHAGRAKRLILSGGKAGMTTEARLMRRTALSLDVPSNMMSLEEVSRNTHENAVLTKALLSDRRPPRIILVTSALHMHRARSAFTRQGMLVHASGVRRQPPIARADALTSWMPDHAAFEQCRLAVTEYLALQAYRLRGRA